MDQRDHFRSCDRCSYVGLDSAGATVVERGLHVVTVECARCAYRQVSAYPAKPEQERAIEIAVAAVRGQTWKSHSSTEVTCVRGLKS